MKKLSICAFLCMFSCTILADNLLPSSEFLYKYKTSGKKEKTSQTFIFPRIAYTLIEARQFLAHEFFADRLCTGATFQAVGIYQKANPSERVGKYFGLRDQNVLTIKGDNVDPINRDIRAEWVGLDANFDSRLSLEPSQTQWATYLEWNQGFEAFTDNWFLSTFYLSLQMPIQHVKNNMNFEAVPAVQEAFTRREMLFAKIPTQSMHETSISELIFRLGSYFLKEDGFELGVYSMFLVPTAKSAKAEFLFDPFLGHNKHWGGGTGFNFQMPLNCSCEPRVFALYVDLEHIFLFRATQYRTLDVRFKEWSRYMTVNSIYGDCNIPAANILTRKMRVEPYSIFDGSGGFRLYNENFALQFGYSCWAHGKEWLRLKEPWLPEYGFSGTGNRGDLEVNCVSVCPTASRSTISCQAANDVNEEGELIFVPIRWQDLNFDSGAARSTLVNRVHIAVGVKTEGKYFAFFAGGGAFGEFPRLNTAFSQWGVWCKLGGAF